MNSLKLTPALKETESLADDISRILLTGIKKEKQEARELLGRAYDARVRSNELAHMIEALSSTTLGSLDRKVKHGQSLTLEEAFIGTCTVLAATNQRFYAAHLSAFTAAYGHFSPEKALALASAFLNLMAAKESFSALTSDEIAGMAAAASLDTVVTLAFPRIIETCGMGGDRGQQGVGQGLKTINASTLSSLVLAGLDLPVLKHGSYGNTSLVGSTEAIEQFGACTNMFSEEAIYDIVKRSGYCFLDAHLSKTLHDLSHLLMMETVNHVIGPMSPPISRTTQVNKVMGVNEKVHPETVAQAYTLLHARGIQNVGGVVVVAGLSERNSIETPLDYTGVRQLTFLDEISPYESVVSLSYGKTHRGTFLLHPEEFGVSLDPDRIFLPNDSAVVRAANLAALSGTDSALADYLAMNAALGYFAYSYAQYDDAVLGNSLNPAYLSESYDLCRAAISDGKASRALARYVEASGGVLTIT